MSASSPSSLSSLSSSLSSTSSFSSSPAGKQFYFRKLQKYIKEFEIIASLQEGERLRQHFDHGHITGKYLNPNQGFSSLWTRFQQFAERAENNDSPERALKRISTLTNHLIKLITAPHTPYDFFCHFSNRLEKLKQLSQCIQRSIQAKGALENYKTTLLSDAESNKEKTEFQQKFEAILEQIKLAAQHLTAKIEEHNKAAEKYPLTSPSTMSEQEQLENLIPKILKPGSSIPLQPVQQWFHGKHVKEVLTSYFGSHIVSNVVPQFYGINLECLITYRELQAFIIGIVANLTLNDITTIFQQKKLPELLELEMYSTLPELAATLQLIRNIDLGGAENVPQTVHYYWQLSGDLSFLHACRSPSTSYTEVLSCEYSYALHETPLHQFAEGTLISFHGPDGDLTCREVHSIYNQYDLYCLALLPLSIKTPLENCSQEDACTMQIIFRGLSVNDPPKMPVDSNAETDLFFIDQKSLLENFFHLLHTRPQINSFQVMGHNKGASHAMQWITVLAQELLNFPAKFSPSSRIVGVSFSPSEQTSDHASMRYSPPSTQMTLFSYDGIQIKENLARQFAETAGLLKGQCQFHLHYFSSKNSPFSKFSTPQLGDFLDACPHTSHVRISRTECPDDFQQTFLKQSARIYFQTKLCGIEEEFCYFFESASS